MRAEKRASAKMKQGGTLANATDRDSTRSGFSRQMKQSAAGGGRHPLSMISHSSLAITFATAMGCCAFSPSLSAGVLGRLIYSDDGTSITITGTDYSIRGGIFIPSTIDGKPVTAIGDGAFDYSRLIRSVKIPPTVTRIGVGAFAVCDDMETVNIPDGVTEIAPVTFDGCSSLEAISLPKGVTRIGSRAFASCTSLARISLPQGIDRIADSLFEGCVSLEEIDMPSTVTKIGKSSFSGCRNLGHLTLPTNLTTVGAYAFAGCNSFTRVTLPPQVNMIGDGSFSGLPFLKKVTLNPALTSIGAKAFRNCSKLSTVTIPGKVTEIGSGAFAYCSQLQSAAFLGDAPEIGTRVFRYIQPDFKIFVSETSKNFTYPIWRGYRTSLPAAEIDVSGPDGENLVAGESSRMFRSTLVGEKGRKLTLAVTNVGTRKLKNISLRRIGRDSSDYVITSFPPVSLEPGRQGIFSVTFTPKAVGKRLARIEISSNDEDENPFEIDLKGVGIVFLN